MGKLSLAVVMILVATVVAYPSKPSFLGCQSSEDCGVDECCVLGTYLTFINGRVIRFQYEYCKSLRRIRLCGEGVTIYVCVYNFINVIFYKRNHYTCFTSGGLTLIRRYTTAILIIIINYISIIVSTFQ